MEVTLSPLVVTSSRADLLGRAITASQGSVTREALRLRPAYRVGQFLESVPGLMVTSHSGEGKANQFLLRGFNLDHGTDIANFIDDVPINRPTNAHGQGYSDLNFIIPQVLDGLDFAKGPYDAAVGDFGAVAALRLRVADVIPDQVSASLGTLGDDELFAGGARGLGARAHVMAAVLVSRVDGPFVPPNDFRKLAAVVRLSDGSAGAGEDLTAMYYKGDGWFSTDQPARAIREGLIGRFGVLDPTDGNRSERLSVSGHFARTTGPWALSASAYVVRSRQTLWNNFTHFLLDPINGDQEQQDESRTLVGGAARATASWTAGPVASQTVLGLQVRHDDAYVDRRHTRGRALVNYCDQLNPDGTATAYAVGQPACNADRVALDDVGVFVETRTRWARWLRTEVGVREEDYSGRDHSLSPGSAFAARAYVQNVSLFQPKASLVLGPWRATEVYLSAGRGFHSDDIRGVSGAVPLEGLPGAAGATPLLVRADGAELGLRSDPLKGLRLQVAAFDLRMASEVVYDQDQGLDQAGAPSDRHGVEVSAQYRPATWLEVNGDLSFSHARFVDRSPAALLNNYGVDGTRIPNAPAFIGSFGALVDGLGPWSGGLQVRILGPYPLTPDNTQRDPGYVETNLDVGYRLSRGLSAKIAIFNLFDVRANASAYYYTTVIPDGRGPVADHQVHPIEPRSARFTLTATF